MYKIKRLENSATNTHHSANRMDEQLEYDGMITLVIDLSNISIAASLSVDHLTQK